MTLPASGQISFGNILNEIGRGASQIDMGFIRGITKGNPSDLNSYHGLTYYQKNNAENCNNGNCSFGDCSYYGDNCFTNCNCNPDGTMANFVAPFSGVVNCYGAQCVNCTNCDGQAYIQGNCNCACAYNCNKDQFKFNCDCNCVGDGGN